MWPFRKKPAATKAAPPRGVMSQHALGTLIEGEPEGVAELADAMLADYQVKLGITVLVANAKQAAVTVVADSGGPAAELLAEQLTDLYSRKLSAMLQCITHGRVAFEKVWDYFPPVTFIETLNELPYRQTRMRLENGQFAGVDLDSKDHKNAVRLGPEKSWWLALDATPTEPHGKSRLVGAPQKVWKDKKEIRRLLNLFIQRFALGAGIIRTPMEFEDPNNPEKMIAAEAVWGPKWNELYAGGLMLLDNKRIPTGDGSPGEYETDVTMLEVAVRDGRPILDVIDNLDAAQLLSLGIPPKTVMEGDSVGSFALVTQQMLILLSVVEDIVSQIVESYQRHVVDKAAEANGDWQLTANFTPLTQRPDDLATELVKSWLTSPTLSPLILAGGIDLAGLLDSVGITAKPDVVERLQRWLDANAANEQVRARAPELAMSASFLDRIWR